AAVRAMLLGLCVFHGPDHVRVCVVSPVPDGSDWGWVKWLPHSAFAEPDSVDCAAMVFRTLHDLEERLDGELHGRARFSRAAEPVPGRAHLVVVLDGGHVTGDERTVADGGIDG